MDQCLSNRRDRTNERHKQSCCCSSRLHASDYFFFSVVDRFMTSIQLCLLFSVCLSSLSSSMIDIVFTVKNLSTNDRLKSNFVTMIQSLLEHTSADNLQLHVIGDTDSHVFVEKTLQTLHYHHEVIIFIWFLAVRKFDFGLDWQTSHRWVNNKVQPYHWTPDRTFLFESYLLQGSVVLSVAYLTSDLARHVDTGDYARHWLTVRWWHQRTASLVRSVPSESDLGWVIDGP